MEDSVLIMFRVDIPFANGIGLTRSIRHMAELDGRTAPIDPGVVQNTLNANRNSDRIVPPSWTLDCRNAHYIPFHFQR